MKKKTLKNSKIKEKSKTKHFPNIIRIFTEKYFLGFLVTFILVAMLLAVGMYLYRDIKVQQKTEKERKVIISKIQYWQGIVDKYKDYRDAYFQLAILEYRLRDFNKSKFYLDKSLAIDPNFEKGRELEKVLSNKY